MLFVPCGGSASLRLPFEYCTLILWNVFNNHLSIRNLFTENNTVNLTCMKEHFDPFSGDKSIKDSSVKRISVM